MNFEDKIREIVPDGIWWNEDNCDKFIYAGKKLLEKGFTEDEALEFLSLLYASIADEYGD